MDPVGYGRFAAVARTGGDNRCADDVFALPITGYFPYLKQEIVCNRAPSVEIPTALDAEKARKIGDFLLDNMGRLSGGCRSLWFRSSYSVPSTGMRDRLRRLYGDGYTASLSGAAHAAETLKPAPPLSGRRTETAVEGVSMRRAETRNKGWIFVMQQERHTQRKHSTLRLPCRGGGPR